MALRTTENTRKENSNDRVVLSLDSIIDNISGKSLNEILKDFNMYFLSYTNDRESTRCKVPMSLRREGLWITYVLYDGTVITEWYNSNNITDTAWGDSSNWREGNNMLVGDISISSDGYWVIGGVVSTTKAQGEKGEYPLLRIDTSTGYIQYSYNNKTWYNLVAFSEITPDIQIGKVTTLAAGQKASVTKSGTNTQPILDFNIPMGNTGAPGVKGDGWSLNGWVNTIEELPTTATLGSTYLVGTTTPFMKYVWRDNTYKWVEVGLVNEVQANVFDGGRADTQYGGARVINCGGADNNF
jgi:hypothetical protein